jgi:hypothetical protein
MCSSITYALKGKKILSGKGITTYLRRPEADSGCGCGYSLYLDKQDYGRALGILNDNGIKLDMSGSR